MHLASMQVIMAVMNKAFVREPEDTGQRHCPRCGSLGAPATADAVREHIELTALANLSETAWFCPFPRCEVAYFDTFERVTTVEQLRYPVWPKDADAPLCSCFGLTCDDIEQDIRDGSVARTRATIEKAKTAEARCQSLSPDGHPCVAEVQRYYMKCRQASSKS
jgi:Zinc binding domain